MIGVAESCEHRGHVLGGLDVLAFDVVDPSRHLNVWGEAVEHACAQECCQGIGMTEIGRETVEGIAQSSMPVEPGEKAQTGYLFAEHIRLVGDVVMAERAGETGQHHVLPPELLPQSASFLKIFFHMVAVGTQHDQLTAFQQIGQCVDVSPAFVGVRPHALHGGDMLRIHAVQSGLGKGSEQIASWPSCEQKIVFIPLLHGAVVSGDAG